MMTPSIKAVIKVDNKANHSELDDVTTTADDDTAAMALWILQFDDEAVVDAMVDSSLEKSTIICCQIAALVSFASALCICLENSYHQLCCSSGNNNSNNNNNINNNNSNISNNRKHAAIISRILLSGSIGTMAFSFGYMMGTWPIPSYYSDLIWSAAGNDQTCTFQGLLFSVGMLIAALWDMALSVTYVLVVNCNCSPRKLDIWEKCLHVFIWPLVLGVTIAAIVLKCFNTDRETCFLVAAPYTCDWDGDMSDCIRGFQAQGFAMVIYITMILPPSW
jgi:hypothetical protein